MAAREAPLQRLIRIGELVAAQPALAAVIGKTMAWEPQEVSEFLHNQFDVDADEFGLIENAIRIALKRSEATSENVSLLNVSRRKSFPLA
ncbi:MAG: hypothetical protein ACR2Q4_04235 [Geminicoccaceae bacterium]